MVINLLLRGVEIPALFKMICLAVMTIFGMSKSNSSSRVRKKGCDLITTAEWQRLEVSGSPAIQSRCSERISLLDRLEQLIARQRWNVERLNLLIHIRPNDLKHVGWVIMQNIGAIHLIPSRTNSIHGMARVIDNVTIIIKH